MIHSRLVFVLKWLPDHLVLAVSIEAAWFFISKTIFHFLIGHTIFDVKGCIFNIRCHQSAHSGGYGVKVKSILLLRSHQLEFCYCCLILSDEAFAASVWIWGGLSDHLIWKWSCSGAAWSTGPLVHWLKLVWRSSLTEWPAIQIPCHKNIYLSRKYEANIPLRIHKSKNIILFCPSNKKNTIGDGGSTAL